MVKLGGRPRTNTRWSSAGNREYRSRAHGYCRRVLTAIVGLAGALVYGAADFLGGLAARRTSAVRVTAVAAFTGLLALLAAVPLVGGEWSAPAVFYGALSGVSGALAISLLYACLAIGPMSILSPLTAVMSAIVPLTWGLLGGERLSGVGYGALALALVAVVLVGFVPEKGAVRPSVRGIVMATTSGAMIGVFLILIDQTPEESGLVPLLLNRVVNGAIMLTIVGGIAIAAARARRREDAGVAVGAAADSAGADGVAVGAATGWVRFAIACGLLDAAANALLLVGIRIGDLAVISVLTAMYPAGTILLAAVVLRERVAPVQLAGLALALVSAGLLALA